MLRKIEGRRRRRQQRMRCLDGITDSLGMSFSKLEKIVKDREAWHAAVHGVAKSWTQLNDWRTTMSSPGGGHREKWRREVKLFSRVWLFVTQWTAACQTPLSMGFSRQEYWSGLPFPSPVDCPNPGIEPRSPALQTDSLLAEPRGKFRGGHFLPQTWPHPRPYRLQYCEPSRQTTNRVGTQSHSSADSCLKSSWAHNCQLNTPLEIALPTNGQELVPPTRKPAHALRLALCARRQTAGARGTTALQLVKWKGQSQKVRHSEEGTGICHRQWTR